MEVYDIDQTFDILKRYKLTTNKESVRRWLRAGVIKGIQPVNRKEGWKVRKDDLEGFIKSRMPSVDVMSELSESSNITNFVKEEIEQNARAKMWWELVRKNIFEGYIEIKKNRINECIQHRKYSKELAEKVWLRCIENSKSYKKPRISYLLEAFLFESQRIMLDENFANREERTLFAIIEYVRKR